MNYEEIIPFEGDFSKAADVLQNTLLPLGFQIINKHENSIEMEGPRSVISKYPNILTYISRIHLQKESTSLILNINFDRIKKNFKFIALFSVVFEMIAIAIVATVMYKGDTQIEKILLIVGILLFGLVTGIPMIYFILKNTANKAVKTIVNNIAAVGNY